MRVGCGCRRPVKQSSFLGCDVGQQGGRREEGGREGRRTTERSCLVAGPAAGGWHCLVVAGWRKGGVGAVCPALLATRSSFRDLDERRMMGQG